MAKGTKGTKSKKGKGKKASLKTHHPKSVPIAKPDAVDKKVREHVAAELELFVKIHGDFVRFDDDPDYHGDYDMFNVLLTTLQTHYTEDDVKEIAARKYQARRKCWLVKKRGMTKGRQAELDLLANIVLNGVEDISFREEPFIPKGLHDRLVVMFKLNDINATDTSHFKKLSALVKDCYSRADVNIALDDFESGDHRWPGERFAKKLKLDI
jgi:hypothetical protein